MALHSLLQNCVKITLKRLVFVFFSKKQMKGDAGVSQPLCLPQVSNEAHVGTNFFFFKAPDHNLPSLQR